PRHIVALALQVVAVICLIVGFSLSSGEPGTFLKALGAGLMVQLMVLAVLLPRR
ncbi:MAG: hypothetical protein IT442_06145, partial [Phycisphaeraceae bacterium]|nr:hypothetical protein [Phycisphaeraceae bacterium]